MKHYTIYKHETAAPEALPVFNAAIEKRGFVPNVYAVYGGTPNALNGFAALTAGFTDSTLTPAEREVILLTTSVHNQCRYCVAGHTYYAKETDLGIKNIVALREGYRLTGRKLQALHKFAKALAQKRGRDSQREYETFLKAGYSHEQALEVIQGVAVKTLSNMTASLLNLPLDAPFVPFAWAPGLHRSIPARVPVEARTSTIP